MNHSSTNSTPLVTYTLIGLCVLVFVAVEATGLPQAELLALYLPANLDFHYWQYLTSLFMHGSLTHLLFNMLGRLSFFILLLGVWDRCRSNL